MFFSIVEGTDEVEEISDDDSPLIIGVNPIPKRKIVASTSGFYSNNETSQDENKSISRKKQKRMVEDDPPSIDLTDEDFSLDCITPSETAPFDLTGEDPKEECGICYNDEVTIYQIVYFKNCPHYCCIDCFQKYLKSKIEEKSFPVLCPECKIEISDRDVAMNLTQEMYSKFEEFRLNHFLEKYQEFKCCLTPSCPNGVFWDPKENVTIWKCNCCKKKYCLKCSDVDHTGTCEEFKQWKIDNGESDSKLEELIKNKILRKCPGCQCATQKKDGCNGMNCTRCKTGWCWNCEQKNTECSCKKNPHAIVQRPIQRSIDSVAQRQRNIEAHHQMLQQQRIAYQERKKSLRKK